MLIIEGPRQSGKKTLASKLALEFALPTYDYSKQLSAQGHVSMAEISKDLRTWPSKELGIYTTHPLINEYIYGPMLRKRVIPEFYSWEVRPLLEFFKDNVVIIYCRSSDNTDSAVPFFDLLFRTPLAQFRVWEYDYVVDSNANTILPSIESYIRSEIVRPYKKVKRHGKFAS